jgi:hypothetical protein
MENKNLRLLAIDVGYSSVKVARHDSAGIIQFDKFINAVAKIDNPLEIDDDIMFNLLDKTYVLGPAALKVSKEFLLDMKTYEDLKTVTPVWISYLLRKYSDVKYDKVVIGLSLAFSDMSDDLLKYIQDTLLIEDDDYFMLLPQGVACKESYANWGLDLSEMETSKSSTTKLRNYLIVDGGFETLDFACVVQGKASTGAAIGIKDSGIIRISHAICDYVFKSYGFQISLKEAQTVVDTGHLIKRGRDFDLTAVVDDYSKKYIGYVLNLLEEKYGSYLDQSNGVLVLGGLGYLFEKFKDDPYVIGEIEKHMDRNFIHWTPVYSEFYNAVAYLKLGEKLSSK